MHNYGSLPRTSQTLQTECLRQPDVFLSLFDDNPRVKCAFCPPKECYDAKLNADGRYGRPRPRLDDIVCTVILGEAKDHALVRDGTRTKRSGRDSSHRSE
jgi:hypothetical protein